MLSKLGLSSIKIIFKKLGKRTHTAFSTKYLLYTNVLLSLSFSGAGDFVEQQYEIASGYVDELSLERMRNMTITGCSAGVITHFWYTYLDKLLPGSTLRVVMKKLILDQLVCSPFVICNMFIIVGLLEKKNKSEIIEEIRDKSLKLYIAEWIIWPPAQFVNFYFIPGRFRILYDNVISFGYDVYYSAVKYSR